MSKLLIDIHYRLCSSQEQALAMLDQIIGNEEGFTTEDENADDTGNRVIIKRNCPFQEINLAIPI